MSLNFKEKVHKMLRTVSKSLLLLSATVLLSGCAGVLPVPGGKDTVNQSFYNDDIDLKSRIDALEEGMSKDEVFMALERHEEDLILLDRSEIIATLYGGQNIASAQNSSSLVHKRSFLQSLTGYRMMFKKVNRKHGFSSPIAMRTNEAGYQYIASFIFKDDLLYEKPVLSGGPVDAVSTKTIFDYLSPGTVMSQAGL